MSNEIEKPENYQEGGLEKIKNFLLEHIPQFIWVTALFIWLVTSICITVRDIIYTEFNHKVLSYSFIFSIVTLTYLLIRKSFLERKSNVTPTKKEPCTKCGKNKTKN